MARSANIAFQDNSLVVRVDASLGAGWFYEGAGLYRHVWLVKTAPVHVPQWACSYAPRSTARWPSTPT